MTKYNELPLFSAMRPQRIHPGMYGDLVAGVYGRVDGLSEEDAARAVGFVLGQLALVSPQPDDPTYTLCGHSYYTATGEWHFCVKGHEEKDDDPAAHRSKKLSWDTEVRVEDVEGWAFEPEEDQP